ncbi:MAG: FAD-binding oxidoreductase [Nanoarchaeota archaeon]
MKHEVFWKNPGYKANPELKKDIECDYLIVGGGITGVATAYFLSKMGAKNIILIEKNTIASGATGMAAGSIVLKGELDLKDILHIYGRERGLRYWKLNEEGLELMKKIIKKEKINCDYEAEDTIYGSARKDLNADVLSEYIVEKDIEPMSQLIVGRELKKEINTPLFKYALYSKDQGISVNPLKFTQNLSQKLKKESVKVYENTPLLSLEKNKATTPKALINFKEVILATDSSLRSNKIKKITSTIIITNPLTKEQLKNISMVPKKIIWDSKIIYHYLKITKDNRILLGYGDKRVHKKHTKIDPHKPHIIRIKKFLKKLFPQLKTDIEYAWSGCFGITDNKIPLIERNQNHIMIGGAASQVMCVMASKYLAEKLTNRKSKMEEFFEVK